ncbi:nuclear transport factor 2 family protein [Rhizorhapis suberifaciens]|uniref:SnoaL-like domain-containing protein n=1 Tax=Rhizorhapis suberifaciens TaxID=13656 RepID=A0A840HU93_9SPHN|nr:nuclear transport factor 2 family protein [Rhizorhapis suberifaciens]MBB4641160.1 hypothetical protein [Rhizorhapis suberifaciens]
MCACGEEGILPSLSIEGRFARQDLVAAYSWALDIGDVEAFLACITPCADVSEEEFDEPDVWVGHDGIRGLTEHYRDAEGFPRHQHHVTQVQYMRQGEGSCKMRSFAFLTGCEDELPYLLRFAGRCDHHAFKVRMASHGYSSASYVCGMVMCSKASPLVANGCRASGPIR